GRIRHRPAHPRDRIAEDPRRELAVDPAPAALGLLEAGDRRQHSDLAGRLPRSARVSRIVRRTNDAHAAAVCRDAWCDTSPRMARGRVLRGRRGSPQPGGGPEARVAPNLRQAYRARWKSCGALDYVGFEGHRQTRIPLPGMLA